jgi:hypothetical protein
MSQPNEQVEFHSHPSPDITCAAVVPESSLDEIRAAQLRYHLRAVHIMRKQAVAERSVEELHAQHNSDHASVISANLGLTGHEHDWGRIDGVKRPDNQPTPELDYDEWVWE